MEDGEVGPQLITGEGDGHQGASPSQAQESDCSGNTEQLPLVNRHYDGVDGDASLLFEKVELGRSGLGEHNPVSANTSCRLCEKQAARFMTGQEPCPSGDSSSGCKFVGAGRCHRVMPRRERSPSVGICADISTSPVHHATAALVADRSTHEGGPDDASREHGIGKPHSEPVSYSSKPICGVKESKGVNGASGSPDHTTYASRPSQSPSTLSETPVDTGADNFDVVSGAVPVGPGAEDPHGLAGQLEADRPQGVVPRTLEFSVDPVIGEPSVTSRHVVPPPSSGAALDDATAVTAAPALGTAAVAPSARRPVPEAIPRRAGARWGDASRLGFVRFLQFFYRRSTHVRPGCWARGGLVGVWFLRPQLSPRCGFGTRLAPEAAFEAQRSRKRACFDWYMQASKLLKKQSSGAAPLMLDLFCSEGGASEGTRRLGGAVHGVDHVEQPRFTARFGGSPSFDLADALDMELLRYLVRRLQPILIWASPPCQAYTTATAMGMPSAAATLIALTRNVLDTLGVPYVIENVMGARPHMLPSAIVVRGSTFGCNVDRPRVLESGGGLVLRMEEALLKPGELLRGGCCLGDRARFPRPDRFGRPTPRGCARRCCRGNIFTVMGSSPSAGSVGDNAAAMGIDASHMSYAGLAQAIPPDYATFVFGQAVMHTLRTRFGFEVPTFDEHLAHPRESARRMMHWLRGAGGTSASQGVEFTPVDTGKVGKFSSLPTLGLASAATSPPRDDLASEFFDAWFQEGDGGWAAVQASQLAGGRLVAVDFPRVSGRGRELVDPSRVWSRSSPLPPSGGGTSVKAGSVAAKAVAAEAERFEPGEAVWYRSAAGPVEAVVERVDMMSRALGEEEALSITLASGETRDTVGGRLSHRVGSAPPPSIPAPTSDAHVEAASEPLFFWEAEPSAGEQACLSNYFQPVNFVDPELPGSFSSSEQYMMYAKAMAFGDMDRAKAIRAESRPSRCRALGRSVRGFDAGTWGEMAQRVVERGVFFKFSQNPHLRRFLLSTGSRELVEASPSDAIWGIGLSASDAPNVPRCEWGTNWLGLVLMRVRARLYGQDQGLTPPELPTSRAADTSVWSLSESDFRELDYTHAGDFDQSWVSADALDWITPMRPCTRLGLDDDAFAPAAASFVGRNTFVHVTPARLERAASEMVLAHKSFPDTTRITVVVGASEERSWSARGFARSWRWSAQHVRVTDVVGNAARLPSDAVAMSIGRRSCRDTGQGLVHARIAGDLDPRDAGCESCPKAAKQALAWSPLHRHPEWWRGKGLPPDVELMMTEGVVIDPVSVMDALDTGTEVAQYAFKDVEHMSKGASECDRAILAGHLEFVPASEVRGDGTVDGCVHPWTVVHQSADKWRACQDYKLGTNRRVISKPFTLPSVKDVLPVITPDSHFAKYDLRDGFWSVGVAPASRKYLMVRHPATGRLLRCTSLPFGYSRSPEHFCRVTESVAQLARKRCADRGVQVHLFVFVDDFLLVGSDADQTRLGMHILEDLLRELGLPFAPHKTRGPARVIEFLGFLISNSPAHRCLALTEGRQAKLLRMVSEWQAREPCGAGQLRVKPAELASLLGHLVFASEVVPQGRLYMMAMLRQFKGLHVDWARGLVRSVGSTWSQITVDGGFWRDLHWWRSALTRQNCLALGALELGEAALVGTDASDFGCGELVWLDGGREESVLRFTAAERRRPINFRELRGTLHALEVWGSRLAGRTVLVETDNTFGHITAGRLHCKSEDSQELVRRISDIAVRYGITLRSVHTPGVMLLRPDQTSRGATPEEPRFRLRADEFGAVAARFGPFTEFMGAEREHQRASVASNGPPRLWSHPTFDTVGSTLHQICNRLVGDPETCPRGVVVVPFAPEAAWWKLTRHFCCVGRWASGGGHLEANVLGKWSGVTSRRPSLLLFFPRAGAQLAPLPLAVQAGADQAEGLLEPELELLGPVRHAWINKDEPLPRGSLLYAPRRVDPAALVSGGTFGVCGTLYFTLDVFDGAGSPRCAELRRMAGGSRQSFILDAGSYDHGDPWLPVPTSLWVVNHLGGEQGTQPRGAKTPSRFFFDFDRAELEIGRARVNIGRLKRGEVGLATLAAEEAAVFDRPDVLADASDELAGDGDMLLEPMSGFESRPARQAPAEGLGDASFLSPAETRARRSVSGSPVLSAGISAIRRRASIPAPAVGVSEPSRARYAGMCCAGCGLHFTPTDWLIPCGLHLVHNRASCFMASVGEQAKEAARDFADSLQVQEAARLAEEKHALVVGRWVRMVGRMLGRSCAPLPTEAVEPASRPVPPPDAQAQGAKTVQGAQSQRQVQLNAALSDERCLMVEQCLAGTCAHQASNEPRMVCIGSCHNTLHGRKCAQLDHGSVVIGCFECPDCRLRDMMPLHVPPYPANARRQALRSMLQELSQGREGTGSGYADYARLEAEWVAEVTQGDSGISVVLPTDGKTSLKAFLLWLSTDRERAKSLDTIWRCVGSYMARTGRPNLTSLGDVKYAYKDLRDKLGVEHTPRTACTPRMLKLAIGSVIAKECRKAIVEKRTKLDFASESGLGFRVGETFSGGDYHGMKANHLIILREKSTGLETVEGMIEHSKTGYKRFANCLGTTLGECELPMAQIIREYWSAVGFRVRKWEEGGYDVEGPDYFVARVSLLGMPEAEFTRLGDVLRSCPVREVRSIADNLIKRATDRYRAKQSMEKRYINVCGGEFESQNLKRVMLMLVDSGFSKYVTKVPGPLMLATEAGTRIIPMPLDPGTTYETLHKIMDECYVQANPPGDPDPWLDLGGMDTPLWGHHSFRRLADTVARKSMARSGATEMDIDMMFGWQERMYNQRMQFHYETFFSRAVRHRVTMYL